MEQAPPSLPVRKAKWPAVFGIIAIVFGGFGLLGGPIQIVSAKFNAINFQQLESSGIEIGDDFQDNYNTAAMAYGISMSVIALVLLIGGIMLLKRKKLGALILQIWAVLKLTIGIFLAMRFSLISNEFAQKTMAQTFGAIDSGGNEGEIVSGMVGIASKIGMIFGILWLAALPVILLVFLNRAKAKKEMSTWGADKKDDHAQFVN